MKTFRVKIGKKYQEVQFISSNLPTVFMKGNTIYAGTDPFVIHKDDIDNYVNWLMGKQPIKEKEIQSGILVELIDNENYLPDFIPLFKAKGSKQVNGKRRVTSWIKSNLSVSPGVLINVESSPTLGVKGNAYRVLDGEIPGQAQSIPVYIHDDFISKIID